MKAKFFGLIIAGIALLLSAGTASAQCGVVRRGPIFSSCNSHSCVTPVVSTVVETPVVTSVVTPVAVPVFVPAFQFQYVPPTAIPVPAGYPAQTVPGIGVGPSPVPVTPSYAQPVAPGVQPGYAPTTSGYGPPSVAQAPAAAPANDKDKIRELAKALLEEMSRQAASQGDQGPPTVSGPTPAPLPAGPAVPPAGATVTPAPGPKTTPGLPPGLPTAPVVSPADAAPLAIATLQAKCSACHTGPAAKGEFVMFAQPGLFNTGIPWRSIVREIDAGRMPPSYSQYRISPQEAAAVRAWLSGI